MAEDFLKRFEKLENIPRELLIKEGIKLSRRFDKLEVSDRRIEVQITDLISEQEKGPQEIIYSVICPYCGAENKSSDEKCVLCKSSLKNIFTQKYQQRISRDLKKCPSCNAMNEMKRRICWLCGKDLSAGASQETDERSNNVIILNIDGKEYRSTDKNLPFDIIVLMEKIRNEGYSKELVDKWVKERNRESQKDNTAYNQRLLTLQLNLYLRILGGIILGILFLTQFRTCFNQPFNY